MAQVFYRAGFIEAWERSYEKILKAFDKANLKRPEFIVEQGGVTAIIHREIFMSVRGDLKSKKTYRTDTNRRGYIENYPENFGLVISLNPFSPKDIASLLNITPAHLSSLRKK